ncbi:MAG: signal peptidase I [Armatimonadetes bacterium]|nr:signal peptidase I [Armatimonadota bacterium]
MIAAPDGPRKNSNQNLSVLPGTPAALQSYRPEETRADKTKRWQRIERMILLPLLLIAVVGAFNLKVGQVDGRSMSPTYETGDRLLLLRSHKTFSPVKVGDIIVVKLKHGKYKGEQWVKRVVFIQNAQGTAQWENEIRTPKGRVSLNRWFFPYTTGRKTVPPNGIMVMGDNYFNSTDSRDSEIGSISPDEIEGKVINVWTSENNYSQAAL